MREMVLAAASTRKGCHKEGLRFNIGAEIGMFAGEYTADVSGTGKASSHPDR
jgi:hypothetical protein